jgi:hypothetical protein
MEIKEALKIDSARRAREESERKAAELAASQREAQRQQNWRSSQRRIREQQIEEASRALTAFETAADALSGLSKQTLELCRKSAGTLTCEGIPMGSFPGAMALPMLLAASAESSRARIAQLKQELAQFTD